MKKILRGVEKFQNEIYAKKQDMFNTLLTDGQHPRVLFITCSDSRIDPFLITQSDPGELFVMRNAGNLVPPYTGETCGEAATIEYAVSVLKIQHIIVCGHSHCGAIAHLIEHHEHLYDEHLPMVSKWLRYADATRRITEGHWDDLQEEERVPFAIETNIKVQLKHLETHPSVAQAVSCGQLSLHGWEYHLDSGQVREYNPILQAFEPVSKESNVKALKPSTAA
jgi:carbonic anhydrase